LNALDTVHIGLKVKS